MLLAPAQLVAVGASSSGQGAPDPPIVINEFMASNRSVIQDGEGVYNDWIELWNTTSDAIDLSGWHLTDDVTDLNQWEFPKGTVIRAGEFMVVFASKEDYVDIGQYLHTNFKLTGGGEYLGLTDPDTRIVHEYAPGFPSQVNDQSYGLDPSGNLAAFDESTPGAANTTTPITGGVFFTESHGFFDEPFELELSTATPGAWVAFTTDGTEPTLFSQQRYSEPLLIDKTTVVRAQAFGPGGPSGVTTQTYVFVEDVVDQRTPPWGWPRFRANDQRLDYGMDPDIVAGNEDALVEALLAIPTLSLVTDPANLFDRGSGIYANPLQAGHDWERGGSLELLDPTGEEDGFEINAGIRIRGSASRDPANPKHSFHLYFRSKYGDSKLAYPLFGEDGNDEFDRIDLTTQQSNSWARKDPDQSYQQTMVRELWNRDTQLAMGQPATRSDYHHLYLNGQYWGVYYTQEVVGEDYAATYWGGAETNYDALKPDRKRSAQTKARDGTIDAWQAIWPLVADQVVTDAEFPRLLEQIDLENLADYYLLHFFAGDADGSPSWWSTTTLADGTHQRFSSSTNWRAVRDRTGGQWAFFDYGSENSLCITNIGLDAGVYTDNTPPWPATPATNDRYLLEWLGPAWIHTALLSHPEYVQVFRDRVSLHLGDKGALSVKKNQKRFTKRAEQVGPAMLAESARWGDANSLEPLDIGDWQAHVDFLVDECLPQRDPIIRELLAEDDLLPLAAPPSLSWSDTDIPYGTEVALANPNNGGVVWYTLDGSDPRAIGGTPAIGAATSTSVVIDDYYTLTARAEVSGKWSAPVSIAYVLTDLPGTPPMILNEYNGVAETAFLAKGGADSLHGRIEGNGGNWFELIVLEDGLDARGWTLELRGTPEGLDVATAHLVFADRPELASLAAGTIIVITDAFADDASFSPEEGDWFINLLSNDADQGAFFTPESQQSFDTHSSNWRLVIRDRDGRVRTGMTGEGIGEFSGVSDQEVGKLEESPHLGVTPLVNYDDGSTSTYGSPNRWDDEVQDLEPLRSGFAEVEGAVQLPGDSAPRARGDFTGLADLFSSDAVRWTCASWRPPCR